MKSIIMSLSLNYYTVLYRLPHNIVFWSFSFNGPLCLLLFSVFISLTLFHLKKKFFFFCIFWFLFKDKRNLKTYNYSSLKYFYSLKYLYWFALLHLTNCYSTTDVTDLIKTWRGFNEEENTKLYSQWLYKLKILLVIIKLDI